MFIKVGQYVLVYIVLIVIFISVLFLTSLLPRSYLHPHIEKTIITLKSEGIYPSFGIPWRKIVLDNYTDALMFNTAYNSSELEPLKASLINLRYYEPQLGSNQIDQLEASLNYTDKSQAGYERYWHGYLTYLRPAVILFSYDAIRIFNAIMLYGGFSWLLILCWKKLGKKFALAILLGFISVDFFFIWKSLQFSAVFLLAIYAAIYLLKSKKKQNY
ncbi:MAG TPA: hypothetical protein PLS49_04270, partial [Candidatus Woesebacteria bacterium]|nr:hypothetical protein [Candidatus Woesebacteria bacterium]